MSKSKEKVRLPREIWVIVAASVAISLGYGIVAPVLPRFAIQFGVTTTAATLVVSAFAFTRLIFAPAAGRLSGRLGERRMYLLGIFIVALSSAASSASQAYWHLLVLRGMGGFGSVMFSVAAMSLVIQLAPPHARGRASAAFGGGYLIGNIAGPALGAVIAPLGYRWPFLIYALMLLIAIAIVAYEIPADGHRRRKLREVLFKRSGGQVRAPRSAEVFPKELPTVALSGSSNRTVLTVSQAFENRRFPLVLITTFVQGWANMGMRVAVVPLLAGTIVLGPSWLPAGDWLAGGAMTAFALGNVVALLHAGRWADFYGRRIVVIWGLVVSGVFTIALGFSATTVTFLLLCFFGGLGAGFIQPAQQGAIADIVGDRQGGRVVSFFQQFNDFGTILGPIIAGLIIDYSGYVTAYIVGGSVLIFAAISWLVFDTNDSDTVAGKARE
ncbi:MFS transporter [Arcanobacterium phocisimile]|uniref:MFS transporter n=1 Tax=Arcanobacterium phocisimile TaxID=1302235 RepID=A0ABX7IGT1_9ACTO|nr:MFS transporter [Arcanobacterium phocisimile]QRV02329.1 MFS transporter [Arcanobacterium phocisimile]